MSTARGGARGRGRGSGGAAPRGSPPNRGASFRGNNARGGTTPRATFGQPSRGNNAFRGARGVSTAPKANGFPPAQQGKVGGTRGGGATSMGWTPRYEALTKSRENERRQAIAQGLVADPERPRSLAEAITPVGTCQDMCAEYERVQRVVQNDIWAEETDRSHTPYSVGKAEPDETRMVKKFRRAAAGVEEQLPSDLRPPAVLQRTCDYLFDEVVGKAAKLEKVHHFVWDRTRAIRNDFSIQQVTKAEDLRLAIDCYERIARFHIVSLHLLALDPKPYDKYDAQQEREQLDRTLLSLMQYYDDSRGRVDMQNEAEFRAYCVIFQLQDPTPDLEDRVQSWPRHVVMDRRVQKALELYAAACNTMDSQGPLKPRASHLVAQQDWQRFWVLADSKEVSYLMACVAEIYFNLVRRTTLNALWRAFRQSASRSPEDWTIDVLCDLFAFDSLDQVYTFCEAYGFSFAERADGQQYLDLSSVKERSLPQPNVGLPKQWRSELVEGKRYGRILPAIINGLAVKEAENAGMVIEEENYEMEMDGGVDSVQPAKQPFLEDDEGEDASSLFIPESQSQNATGNEAPAVQPLTNGFGGAMGAQPTTSGTGSNPFSFGSPSGSTSTFGKPSVGESLFTPKPADGAAAPVVNGTPGFNFLSSAPVSEKAAPAVAEPSAPTSQPTFNAPNFDKNVTFKFDPKPTVQGAGELAPKSSFGLPSVDQNSVFSQGKTNLNSPETSPTQTFPFPTSGAAAKASQGTEKPPTAGTPQNYKQPFLESAPTSPEKLFTFGEPAPAADNTSSHTPVTQTESKTSQPHFTPSNPAQSTGSANGATQPSSLGRKPSIGLQQPQSHKPARPSPLRDSVSFEDVRNSNATGEGSSKAAGKQPVKELFPGAHKASAETKSLTPAIDDLSSIVSRLADEISNDRISGFLTQYVQFAVQQEINSAKAEVDLERDTGEANRFRKAVLFRRYFKRWKDSFWSKKFAKRGSGRRERARRGLEELRRSQGSDTNSVFGNSRATSMAGSMVDDLDARRKMADSTFQQSARGERRPSATSAKQQAKPGSKRPLSSHGADTSTSVREGGHKRMKSTSHVDDRGRVTKPAPTSNPHADILKRSSFLGFKMPVAPLDRTNTGRSSNYFQLKAMGIPPGGLGRGTKRRREESTEASPRASPPSMRTSSPLHSGTQSAQPSSLRMSTLLESRREQPRQASLTRQSPLAAATNDTEKSLFARLKAARESLAEGTTYLKDEVAKEEEFKKSMSASQSSNDSPSMVRARVEARWRASHAASATGTAEPVNDVPAYRLRESRFVPREQYGKAIERAKELRESRANSRPESRADEEVLAATSAPPVQKAQPDKPAFSSQQGFYETQSPAAKVPNGLSYPTLSQWQPPSSTVQESQPFSNMPQPTGWNFVNNANQGSSFQQTSVESTAPDPFSSFVSQPSEAVWGAQPRSSPPAERHDFTIQPSQVDLSLSNSFGNSQPQAFGQPSANGFGQPSFHNFEQHSPTPPQPDSYMHTQRVPQEAVSLFSDDDEEDPPAYANQFAQQPAVDGEAEEHSDDLLDNAEDEGVQDSYQYTESNLYSVLAHEVRGDTEEDVEEGQGAGEFQSQMGEESDEEEQGINGYAYDDEEGGYEDEDLDGDVEDAEEYDDDEPAEDDEETVGETFRTRLPDITNGDAFEDEEKEEFNPGTQRVWNQQPPKNSALQGVGGTEEEAIELSD